MYIYTNKKKYKKQKQMQSTNNQITIIKEHFSRHSNDGTSPGRAQPKGCENNENVITAKVKGS